MRLHIIAICCIISAYLQARGQLAIQTKVDEVEFKLDEAKGEFEAAYKGKRLLLYSFHSSQFKPYVKELRTLKGENILIDAPPDHLHHHGLMYAIRVNGINFWEETENAGRQIHKGLHKTTSLTHSQGKHSIGFEETIHWVGGLKPGTPSPALLIENRELTLTISEKTGEVALLWHARFMACAEKITLHGSRYNGLGLRLPPTWDKAAIHRNSENLPYTAEQKSDLTPARWAAVSHAENGTGSTVLLFGSPQNAGETRFYSMINPFTYLSATQNLESKPLEYSAGQEFELKYLVLAYPGEKGIEFIQERYGQWLENGAK